MWCSLIYHSHIDSQNAVAYELSELAKPTDFILMYAINKFSLGFVLCIYFAYKTTKYATHQIKFEVESSSSR
jgi:hypothetical protein